MPPDFIKLQDLNNRYVYSIHLCTFLRKYVYRYLCAFPIKLNKSWLSESMVPVCLQCIEARHFSAHMYIAIYMLIFMVRIDILREVVPSSNRGVSIS